MEVINLIRNLANTTPRSSVMKKLADLRITYRESAVPLTDAVKDLGNNADLGPELKAIHSRFRDVKNFGGLIGSLVKSAPKVGEMLEEKLASEFDSRIANSGLSYRQANILMLIEMYAFLHRYALRYMAYAFDELEGVKKEETVSRVEVKQLSDQAFAFVRGIEIISTPTEKLNRLLNDVTEAIVDRETHEIFSATQGGLKTDPLTLGFVDVRFNPFFLAGRWLADREIESYYVAKEERESLALRLIRHRERAVNQPTQELQDSIIELEDAIRRRQRKIDDMEAKYGS